MNPDGSGAASTGVQCSNVGCAPRWQPAGPRVNTGGLVIHAGVSPVVSPGSLVDIYGADMAVTPVSAPASATLPITLGGVQVLVNNTPAPLVYVSPRQIIFQVPYEIAPGTAPVVVLSDNTASATVPMTVEQAAPGILTSSGNRAVDTIEHLSFGEYLALRGPINQYNAWNL